MYILGNKIFYGDLDKSLGSIIAGNFLTSHITVAFWRKLLYNEQELFCMVAGIFLLPEV